MGPWYQLDAFYDHPTHNIIRTRILISKNRFIAKPVWFSAKQPMIDIKERDGLRTIGWSIWANVGLRKSYGTFLVEKM